MPEQAPPAGGATPELLTLVGTLSEGAIAKALQPHLAGTPIAPSSSKSTSLPPLIVWTDVGDELALHLDGTRVLVHNNMVFVSVDIETDQTGRRNVAVCLAVASAEGRLGLVAVTEAEPRGDPRIISRWGAAIEQAVWQGLLAVVMEHAPKAASDSIVLRAHPGVLAIYTSDASAR
jgi:hypothetical protein